MTDFGILSLVPPMIAIALAIKTKQIIPSLILGLLAGYWIITKDFLGGILSFIEGLVAVFSSAGNTRTVMFTLLIGALIQLIRISGGVNGFVRAVQGKILKSKSPKSNLQLAASLTGFLIFIESNISILTVGTVFRSLFDKFQLSRQKLAYIADSSSAPSCILFPLNAWGAYIIGLLAVYEGISPFSVLLSSIPFNFYPILTLIFVGYLAKTNKSFGPMKSFDNINPEVTQESQNEITNDSTGHAKEMLIPLAAMIVSMPLFLFYTGWSDALVGSTSEKLWQAISDASGSAAVLYAVIFALIVAGIQYGLQGLVNLKGFFEEGLKGMEEMLTMAILMVLAFALGDLCKELGTGIYVAKVSEAWLAPALAPAMLFITSCFIAFSTGTSWGTFAIMISIAVPLSTALGIDVNLVVAAVLGGGVFGDHCSPISDTTLIASMASGSSHIDHVRTQLPYALVTGGISVVLYLITGFLMV
ncbi:MAG: tetracycline resistance efflux pump [Marinoscillum sp.]|jgi:tetracycline resistance efflux pump